MTNATMKAVVAPRYGSPDVLRYVDLPKPSPKDGEVLVRIRATTVNSGDVRMRGLNVPRGLGPLVRLRMGITRPRQPVLGIDLAGEVESVGRAVTAFRPGDRVLGSPGFAFGCHAEYRCLPGDGTIVKIPDALSFEDAVALPFGGSTVLAFFRRAQLKPGETILVNGASGAVGTVAIQLAKHIGATVTAVASGRNADLVRSLGADDFIDYTTTDFAASGAKWDVIMDNVGNAPYARVKGALKPGGRFLLVIGGLGQMIGAGLSKAIVTAGPEKDAVNARIYAELLRLWETGALRPVIGARFPLAQAADAHRLVDTGHKVGSVVLGV
ncbi:MAG: NAD(P)-dependent alcohol dehydrogenase [Bauldia sp.]|nr:NAD(P)-dependent alcohol dehydrogenase [Bauldia sp.]